MIKVAWVRGSHLNRFEGQNYIFKDSIRFMGFGSTHSIHTDLPFPVIRLPTIGDYIPVTRPIKIITNRLLGDAQVLFGLSMYAKEFDIFHTADPHYYYSYQLARLRKSGRIKNLVVTSWETIPFNNESVAKKREIKRFVLDQADSFLCYTERAKDCLLMEGIEEKKITVCKLGVDIRRFSLNTSYKKKAMKGITILFVGRLVEEKGILDLYHAFSVIKAHNDNIYLNIVGTGPLQNRLESMIRKDKFAGCVTIKSLSYDQMPSAYRTSDLMVLLSKKTKTWEEQYGMVLVEAMASGIPLLCYETGAISEIIGNAGILISPDDQSELILALGRMIKDKNLRKKLGKMGRRRAVAYFDSSKVAQNISRYYVRCFENRK